MNYNKIFEILLSKEVYTRLKQNEQEIFEIIPELKKCKGFEQNNEWHIYDVYEHILHVVAGTEANIYLRLSALFHDIGKPFIYTKDENGIGHFYNHWNKSIEIFNKYQDKFNLTKEEISLVNNLIFYHDINIEKMNAEEINNMVNTIGIKNIELLFALKRSDLLAQSPEYHYLITNINNQEQALKNKKLKLKH